MSSNYPSSKLILAVLPKNAHNRPQVLLKKFNKISSFAHFEHSFVQNVRVFSRGVSAVKVFKAGESHPVTTTNLHFALDLTTTDPLQVLNQSTLGPLISAVQLICVFCTLDLRQT